MVHYFGLQIAVFHLFSFKRCLRVLNKGLKRIKEVDKLTSTMKNKLLVSVDRVNWAEAGKSLKWAALLRLVSGKSIMKQSVESVLSRIWNISEPATFLKVERSTLLVIFKSAADQHKVLDGGPWSVEGNAVLLQQWESGMTEEDFHNNLINVWVQVRRLPFEFRCYKYAKDIVKFAGEVVENISTDDQNEEVFCGQFVRIKIRLDVSKPILPGLFLRREDRNPVWIAFKYEKLPIMCFKCGLIGHDFKMCKVSQHKKDNLFGNWMKAEDSSVNVQIWSGDGNSEADFMVVSLPDETTGVSPKFKEDLAVGRIDSVEPKSVTPTDASNQEEFSNSAVDSKAVLNKDKGKVHSVHGDYYDKVYMRMQHGSDFAN